MNKNPSTFIKYFVLSTLSLISLISISCSQSKIDKIEKLISTYSEYGKFNGSVLIAEKGEVIYKKGFGMAIMEWNIPNTADTKHRLGSVTKQFTAMLIVQLASENKLDLHAPISTYLPGYPKKNGNIITIHHLLTHTSGIPDFTSFPGYHDMMRNPHKPGEIVKLFSDSMLEFAPGEKFAYSNSGYILLGAIIEKITGKSYELVLQDKILTPLKMYNSGYDHNSDILKNRSMGYDRFANTFKIANYVDMSTPYAAGGMYSTVEDMYLWDQALYSEKLLPTKFRDLLFEKYIPASSMHYGYGWFIGEISMGMSGGNSPAIFHDGVINGYRASIARFPSDSSLVVLLNNTGTDPLMEITIAINGILHDKPYAFPKKSIAWMLLDVTEKEGIASALLIYEKVKNSDSHYLNENEMNQAGYLLLRANKPNEAAAIFKLIVEAFPDSFNAYDSYGESLLVLGNKTQAIENYTKSVQLNPGNAGGIKVLKELGVNTDALIKKVPVEQLRLLEGAYMATNQSPGNGEWRIEFDEVNGELIGNDRGYHYKLVPVGENKFVNQDDGASIEFNSNDKNAISCLLFGKFRFLKVK